METKKLISLDDLQRVEAEISIARGQFSQIRETQRGAPNNAYTEISRVIEESISLLTRLKHEINRSVTPPPRQSLQELYTLLNSILGSKPKSLLPSVGAAHNWSDWVATSEAFSSLVLAYERGLSKVLGASLSKEGRETIALNAIQERQLRMLSSIVPALLSSLDTVTDDLQIPKNVSINLNVKHLKSSADLVRYLTSIAVRQQIQNLRERDTYPWYESISGVGKVKGERFEAYMSSLPITCIATLSWQILGLLKSDSTLRYDGPADPPATLFILDEILCRL